MASFSFGLAATVVLGAASGAALAAGDLSRQTPIEVTVDLKNEGQPWVEFLVKSEHKHDFVAHESHPDLLAAVDLALGKLEMQVRRYKEKIQDRRRTPSAGEVAGAPPAPEAGE